MVKFIGIIFVFILSVNAQSYEGATTLNPLMQKVQMLVTPQKFQKNRAFINIIFEPQSAYYRNGRVKTMKVVKTLQENGLLNLFFQNPQRFTLHFKTNGSPLFFVKVMRDTLRDIGYYRYVTIGSSLDSSAFTWSVSMKSEYATDPLILQKELKKSGCSIVDIERDGLYTWSYSIDMRHVRLQVKKLKSGKQVHLKRSLYPHWLDISKIKTLYITSGTRNNWYPYIAYYDNSLHLIELIKKNKKTKSLRLHLPKNARYIKISDLYTLKNIKDGLTLSPKGYR